MFTIQTGIGTDRKANEATDGNGDDLRLTG